MLGQVGVDLASGPLGGTRRAPAVLNEVLSHVRLIALPGQTLRLELVGDRLHSRWEIASLPDRLLLGAIRDAGCQLRACFLGTAVAARAVILRVRIGRLAGDLGDVVVEALVADPVVVGDEGARWK